MERDPSGTEYGQYWQPEDQQAEGHPPPVPPQGEGYDQSGYGYPAQPYPEQQPYQEQSYPEQQSYPDPPYQPQPQQYAAYPEQQQYPAAPYPDQGYYQPTPNEYQPTPNEYQPIPYEYQPAEYQYGVPPQQQGYQPAADTTAQWSAAEMYQSDPYQAEYPPPEYPPAAAEPPVAEPELAADPDQEPAPDPAAAPAGPLLPRLAAAATGRAPGTDRRSFLIRAGIGGLALIVVAAAGYAVAGKGSTKKPTAGAVAQANLAGSHSKAWSAPAVPATAGNDGLLGSWLLPTALVRGDGAGVTAYDTAKGAKLWTVAPPAPGAVPCAMSPSVSSTGIGAVLFQAKPGTGQACTLLVAVDTATGQQKWTATINKATKAYGASVMVNDTRAVAVGDAAAVGYDLTTGKQSWTYAGPGKFCGALGGSGAGSTLLLQSTCADTSPKQQAIDLDADTGKLTWWRGLPQTASSYTVLSAAPAVVAVHMTDAGKDSIMSFSAKGDTQATIFASQTAGMLDSTHGAFDPDPALFFQGSTMIAEITPGGAASGTAGLLTAFNLVDGKQLWQATPKEKGRSALVGIDGTAAVVATEERIGQQAKLSHYDLATGQETAGGNFPRAPARCSPRAGFSTAATW
ncbi:outer membrane protein assembly factor BamB family protein [Streptacidiphilus sp. PAMC 29251]